MSPKKKQLKLVGYVRVSQVGERDQDDSLRSPDQQRDAIKAYVKAHGHTLTLLEVRNGGYVNEHAHEPIVDEEAFEAATKSRFYNPRTGSIAAQGFLTTLVTCSRCGHRLSVTGTSSKREDGQRRASYFCRGHHAVDEECDARAVVQVNLLDAHVEPVLIEALRSGDPRVASFSKVGELMALAIATYTDAKANLDAILSAPASTREKLGDRYWTEVEKKQAATEAAQVGFSEALRMSETIAWKTITKPDGTHDRVEAAPQDLVADLTSDETPVVRRREIARALIEKVVVAKADPKRRRWQPIDERVEVVFREAASNLEEQGRISDEQLEKLYESMSDDDLASFWNHSGITDDMGELEEELMSRGFEDLWRPNGRRNRRLDAGDKDGWQRFFSENAPP